MTSLIFEHSPALPCVFSATTSTFTACLSCGTASEIRYCDGTTKPTWSLCSKHQDLRECGKISYDEEMLQFLRESVYDGSIPKPKPKLQKPVPTSSRTQSPSPSPKLNSSQTSLSSLDPEHDLILRSQLTDKRKCVLCTSHKPRVFRKEAVHVLWPVPTASYSHAQTCFHNLSAYLSTSSDAFPQTLKLLSTPLSLIKQDAHYSKAMVELSRQANERWVNGDQSHEIEQRVCEMREELMASRLAKGMFFRRCNGMYVNVLGWVWQDKFELEVEEEDGAHLDKNATECASQTKSKQHSRDHVTQRMYVDGASESSLDCINNQGFKVHNIDKGKVLINDPTGISMQGCHYNTQLQEEYMAYSNTTQMTSSSTSSPPMHQHNTKPQPSLESPSTTAPATPTSNTTAISTTRLLAREHLVQSKTVSEEDLIITSWAWHQQHQRTRATSDTRSPQD